MSQPLTDPAKLLLLTSLLADDGIISNNGKTYLKELILRRDPRLAPMLAKFEEKDDADNTFVEQIHDLIMTEASAVYDELFEDTSLEVGKTLSKDEREKKQLGKEKSLIYGEVEFNSFYRVLRKINPEPGTIFYDLGSGTGKAVFVARFTQDFAKCIGIEILEGLHNQASLIVQRYNESFKDDLYYGQQNYAACYEGSFLDYDWSDGDIVFANSTCFDDDLMDSLSQEAENLKPGAIVVTFTKGMTTDKFEVLERKRYKMSWGPATVFIHRRLNEDGTPVGPPRLNILPSDNITYDDDDNAAYTKAYGGSSNKNDDDEDEDDEDDEEDDDEDDIDENERNDDDDDDEEEDDEENDEEDDDNEEEDDDEEEGEEDESDADFDIDEYIKKITSEMKRKNYLSKTVDSEEDQDDYEDDDEEAEEKAGDADDEEASGESPDEEGEEIASGNGQREEDDDEEEGDDDNDDDEDDDEDGDDEDGEGDEGSEDLNAVAAEMEEQIRQITERINYNKSLISSYTEKLNSPSRTSAAANAAGAGSIESSSGSNSPAGLSGYSKESTSPASFQGKASPRTSPVKASPNTQPIPVSSNGSGRTPVKSTDHLSIQSPSNRDYNAEFLAMTSPQDSALQMRKRLASQNAAARKLQQPNFEDLSN